MPECIIPEFYKHWEPTARKVHRCVECGTAILKGEKHFQYVVKWEGDISGGRQHLLCMEACMLIRDEIEDECILFGGLFEWYGEHDLQMRSRQTARQKYFASC